MPAATWSVQSQGSFPNIHPVLSIPELLDLTFGFMDRASNINNACVCRRWSEIALDNLWREVDNLFLLFNLLAPLQSGHAGYTVGSYSSPSSLSAEDSLSSLPDLQKLRIGHVLQSTLDAYSDFACKTLHCYFQAYLTWSLELGQL